ncbi:MAG: hypothetical protein IT515_07210 [Burkholderiales bacterium]|nr:hypothetical protein [Burkholderiales bacterium]
MANDWPRGRHELLERRGIRRAGVASDAGGAALVRMCEGDVDPCTAGLTADGEGVAAACGFRWDAPVRATAAVERLRGAIHAGTGAL